MKYEIKPIGIIHTPYKTKEDCPIQGQEKPEGKGKIELFPKYVDGLYTLETFSHLIILYLFDRAGEVEMQRKPYVPRFDHRPDANNGWLEGKTFRPKPDGRE
ncbi:MAG: SAM-dependent methyltransferase [Bacteroidetes bacterium]|nr:SAM-dependent methyltransferase [Bacteroidota bacterium]